jgi:hypothetical protein
MNSDVSDPAMKNQQFGPSQIGIAGGGPGQQAPAGEHRRAQAICWISRVVATIIADCCCGSQQRCRDVRLLG